ncbi:CpsD/CapB family tyrosine-protein kinase [Neobacillus endophyticus]|uniref:CpsD/CapB family tyrosine-protein kinase n=1 Tax=Neobacillus endophyticus TaxID=2738405 RepID=UPI001FE59BF2|nr:CpsD/CapB family tyrosine-protein kinase [Neobacillus endophyticus]
MALKKRKKNEINNRRNLIALSNPKSPISEQYRTLRTNIQYSSIDEQIQSFLVTSPGPEEGKSTTAANAAVVFAQQGKKVLLVDADMRKPTIHYTFNKTNVYGLTTVLTRQKALEEAIHETDQKNLYVLTSGPIPPNPAELLGSNMMDQFCKEALDETFDLIIFDTPPLLAVADAQILANKCQGTILVVSSGKTETEQMIKAKGVLDSTHSKLIGIVLNNKEVKGSEINYYYGAQN